MTRITLNGAPVESIDITSDGDRLMIGMSIGLGVSPRGGGAPAEASWAITGGALTYTTAGDSVVTFTVTAPAEYAGSYDLTIADLADGPVNLIPATASDDGADPNIWTADPGIWVYADDDSEPIISQAWSRSGVPIPDADALTYEETASDIAAGLSVVVTATSSNGPRSTTAVAIAEPAIKTIRFNGTDTRAFMPFVTNGRKKFTIATRVKRVDTGARPRLIGQSSSGLKVDFWEPSGAVQLAFLHDGGGGTPGTATQRSTTKFVAPGDTVSLMFSVDLSRGLTGTRSVDVWADGVRAVDSGFDFSTYTFVDTSGVLVIASQNSGATSSFYAFDFSQWLWASTDACLDPTTYWSSFFEAGTHLPKDLSGGASVIGGVTPNIFLNGTAAQWSDQIVDDFAGTVLGALEVA